MNKTSYRIAIIILFLLTTGMFSNKLFAEINIFRVISGSMEPAMPTGSLILVKRSQNTLFEPGQIITFSSEDLMITHRVIDVGYDQSFYYITKGDANENPDSKPVQHQQVLGRVVFILPPALLLLKSTLRIFTVLLFLLGTVLLVRTAASPKKSGHRRRNPYINKLRQRQARL